MKLIIYAAIAGMALLGGFALVSLSGTAFLVVIGFVMFTIAVLVVALIQGSSSDSPGQTPSVATKSAKSDSANPTGSGEFGIKTEFGENKFDKDTGLELKTEFGEQTFDNELKAGYQLYYAKYVPFDDMILFLENSYKVVKFHKAKKFLVNLEKIPVHDPKAVKYVGDVWLPTIHNLGVSHIAFVNPALLVGQTSAEKAHQSAETIGGLVVHNFPDEKEARKWLASIKG